MLKCKSVHQKKIYKFDFDHILVKRTVFVLIVKNVIKNQKFNFRARSTSIVMRMCSLRSVELKVN